MSKRNMLLGLATGKVGDLVFYRDGGEQRTRTRVIPRNPRSFAQMAQRVKIANVSATYRLLASVLRDSFSNRPSNQSGYNAFSAGAIGLAPYMPKDMASIDAVLPMPAFIAKGTLAGLPYTTAAGGGFGINIALSGWNDGSSSTVAALSALLLAQYPQLQAGDVITAISIQYSADSAASTDAYRAVASVASIKLDVADESGLPAGFNVPEQADNLPLFPLSAESNAAAGVIISRVDGNGQLQCSSAVLELSAAARELYDSYRTEAALDDAVVSYGVSATSILRD